jgi:prepilin-type N-terminal cleavage/methylation domain-containing protein
MKTSSCKSFTLIELLVVIAIIAILAGLVFPAIGTVRNNAKKSKASSEAQSLKAAIIMYESEFSVWPVKSSGQSGDALLNDTDYKSMCEALTGANSKKMIFYEVGAGYDDNKGILDPWGNPYMVILDFGYDGKLDNIDAVKAVNDVKKSTSTGLRSKVAVYSYGAPKENDDVKKKDLKALYTKQKLVISW